MQRNVECKHFLDHWSIATSDKPSDEPRRNTRRIPHHVFHPNLDFRSGVRRHPRSSIQGLALHQTPGKLDIHIPPRHQPLLIYPTGLQQILERSQIFRIRQGCERRDGHCEVELQRRNGVGGQARGAQPSITTSPTASSLRSRNSRIRAC